MFKKKNQFCLEIAQQIKYCIVRGKHTRKDEQINDAKIKRSSYLSFENFVFQIFSICFSELKDDSVTKCKYNEAKAATLKTEQHDYEFAMQIKFKMAANSLDKECSHESLILIGCLNTSYDRLK